MIRKKGNRFSKRIRLKQKIVDQTTDNQMTIIRVSA